MRNGWWWFSSSQVIKIFIFCLRAESGLSRDKGCPDFESCLKLCSCPKCVENSWVKLGPQREREHVKLFLGEVQNNRSEIEYEVAWQLCQGWPRLRGMDAQVVQRLEKVQPASRDPTSADFVQFFEAFWEAVSLLQNNCSFSTCHGVPSLTTILLMNNNC